MKENHGLAADVLRKISGVLSGFPEVETATLFGSRAKGTHRPGSDIDLALSGNELSWRTLVRIDDALDDAMLPYTFSLVIMEGKLDQALAAHIGRVGYPIFERQENAPAV